MSLTRYIVRRGIQSIITFFIILAVTFVIIRIRGNPLVFYIQNPRIPAEVVRDLIEEWGINEPLHIQFINYLLKIFQLDLGYSIHYRKPVIELIATYLPWSIWLLGMSVTISLVLSMIIGSYLATRYGSRLDRFMVFMGLTIRSFPVFWIGMIILYYFAYTLNLFPISPTTYLLTFPPQNILEWITTLFYISALPIISLAMVHFGGDLIIMRGAALSVSTDDYVVVAKAVGFSNSYILRKIIIRNSVLPMVTYASLNYALIMSGSVIIEAVFSYPGVGWLIYQAVLLSDYFLIQGAFLILSLVVIVFNFITDLIYMLLDPRVRLR